MEAPLTEKDLVMIRLNNNPNYKCKQRHFNVWVRVMFVDTDGTFIGRVEKVAKHFTLHQVGEDVRLQIEDLKRIYKHGEQWCYSDNVTVCDCSGLCRNK